MYTNIFLNVFADSSMIVFSADKFYLAFRRRRDTSKLTESYFQLFWNLGDMTMHLLNMIVQSVHKKPTDVNLIRHMFDFSSHLTVLSNQRFEK